MIRSGSGWNDIHDHTLPQYDSSSLQIIQQLGNCVACVQCEVHYVLVPHQWIGDANQTATSLVDLKQDSVFNREHNSEATLVDNRVPD